MVMVAVEVPAVLMVRVTLLGLLAAVATVAVPRGLAQMAEMGLPVLEGLAVQALLREVREQAAGVHSTLPPPQVKEVPTTIMVAVVVVVP
jgi:hypothetical protein